MPIGFENLLEELNPYSYVDLINDNIYIKPTKNNAIIISYFLLSCLEENSYALLLYSNKPGTLHSTIYVATLHEHSSLFMTLGWPCIETGKYFKEAV